MSTRGGVNGRFKFSFKSLNHHYLNSGSKLERRKTSPHNISYISKEKSSEGKHNQSARWRQRICSTSSFFCKRTTSGWRGCDLTPKINSLHPILLDNWFINQCRLLVVDTWGDLQTFTDFFFENHNYSWSLKKLTPIRLESLQLSRVTGGAY